MADYTVNQENLGEIEEFLSEREKTLNNGIADTAHRAAVNREGNLKTYGIYTEDHMALQKNDIANEELLAVFDRTIAKAEGKQIENDSELEQKRNLIFEKSIPALLEKRRETVVMLKLARDLQKVFELVGDGKIPLELAEEMFDKASGRLVRVLAYSQHVKKYKERTANNTQEVKVTQEKVIIPEATPNTVESMEELTENKEEVKVEESYLERVTNMLEGLTDHERLAVEQLLKGAITKEDLAKIVYPKSNAKSPASVLDTLILVPLRKILPQFGLALVGRAVQPGSRRYAYTIESLADYTEVTEVKPEEEVKPQLMEEQNATSENEKTSKKIDKTKRKFEWNGNVIELSGKAANIYSLLCLQEDGQFVRQSIKEIAAELFDYMDKAKGINNLRAWTYNINKKLKSIGLQIVANTNDQIFLEEITSENTEIPEEDPRARLEELADNDPGDIDLTESAGIIEQEDNPSASLPRRSVWGIDIADEEIPEVMTAIPEELMLNEEESRVATGLIKWLIEYAKPGSAEHYMYLHNNPKFQISPATYDSGIGRIRIYTPDELLGILNSALDKLQKQYDNQSTRASMTEIDKSLYEKVIINLKNNITRERREKGKDAVFSRHILSLHARKWLKMSYSGSYHSFINVYGSSLRERRGVNYFESPNI